MQETRLEEVAGTQQTEFHKKVIANQTCLTSSLKTNYDFIVCGSGSSGSVVARRLAENPAANVLLIEAGGSDDVPSIQCAGQWPANLGSERDWAFKAEPNARLNGHSMPLNMGLREGRNGLRSAKMGCDTLSLVDSRLRVYGVENLRIADASIMPRVTTGNTMAPCVVIGERAGEMLKADHHL